MTRSTRRCAPALLTAAAMAAAACSSDDSAAPPTTVDVTTTTIAPPATGDGQLVLGLMLPVNDPSLGGSLTGGAELAVRRINAAGGVLDRPVRTVVADEGVSAATAATAIQSLLSADVDAIIGPASSVVALNVLDDIVSGGVVACSPTASALALDDYPDDELFFRTVPSDSLQAVAIAEVADQTGAQRATIVHADDAYGRGLEESVAGSLAAGSIVLADSIALQASDEDYSDEARSVAESDTQILIVLADAATSARFLEALDAVDDVLVSTVITNDAIRSGETAQRIAALDPTLRTKIVGVGPQAEATPEPFDPPGPFAANAYDCANLIALAAEKVGSDAPRDIAGQIASVSASGSVCRTYADCLVALDGGLQIDYNGPSGVTELLVRRGDPARATFDRFTFDENGRDQVQRTFVVGA